MRNDEDIRGTHAFDSVEEAEQFLQQLADRVLASGAPEVTEAPPVPPSYEVTLNNEEGPTMVQWIGARMEQEGDPKVYVDVTVGPIYPRDQTVHKDIRPLQIHIWRFSFYFQW